MLSLYFALISAFISLRQMLIIRYRSWSALSIITLFFFSALTLILSPHAVKSISFEPLAWLGGVLGLWLCYDIYTLKNQTFKPSKIRILLGMSFAFMAILFVSCITLPHLFASKPILRIELTAEPKKEMVTWKTPSGPLQTQSMTSYRVIIKDMDEKSVFDGYLYGELAAVRLKLLSFPKWMQWLGFPHLWHAEAISSDYLNIEKKRTRPSETFSLTSTLTPFWEQILWRFWEKGFYYEGKPFFLSSFSLTSTHFPLLDRKGNPLKGSFQISLSQESAAPFTAKVEGLQIRGK